MAIEQLGGLDILVNNAGIGAQGGIEDNDDAEWQHVFDVNVFGMVRVTRAALPALRESAPPRSSTRRRSPPRPACRRAFSTRPPRAPSCR